MESLIWQKYAQNGTSVHSRSWAIIGTTQIGKSPAMPPPIWKKPTPGPPEFFRYQSARNIMYSIPLFMVDGASSPLMQYEAKILPSVLSSQPGTMIGRFFSAAASIQECAGSISYSAARTPLRSRRYRYSWGNSRSPAACASFQIVCTCRWILRKASSSGMQVSVTRFSPWSSSSRSWTGVRSRYCGTRR